MVTPLRGYDAFHLKGVRVLYFLFKFRIIFATPDLSNVTDMGYIFGYASAFNQDIGGWNTENVIYMNNMFYNASAFSNHDLRGWNVTSVTTHVDFLTNAGPGNIAPLWP